MPNGCRVVPESRNARGCTTEPVGVRYSLSVAQGLLKIPFGAITALLGIILVSTQSSVSGLLGSQAGLITAAVVFGYSQQLFTRLIDRQATGLLKAASPATPTPDPGQTQ